MHFWIVATEALTEIKLKSEKLNWKKCKTKAKLKLKNRKPKTESD